MTKIRFQPYQAQIILIPREQYVIIEQLVDNISYHLGLLLFDLQVPQISPDVVGQPENVPEESSEQMRGKLCAKEHKVVSSVELTPSLRGNAVCQCRFLAKHAVLTETSHFTIHKRVLES